MGGLTLIVVGGAYQELESTSILSLKEEKCILTKICFGQSGKKMIEGNMIRRDQQIFYPATYLYRKVLFGVIIFFLKCRVRGGGTPILTWSRKFPSGKSSGEERSYEMV